MTEQQQQSQTNQGGEGGGGGGSEQQQAAPWFAKEQAEYVTNKGWKTPADVVTSNQNLEQLLGADKAGRAVVLPKDDKDVEGIKAFRAKIGVPESADKYELPVPQGGDAEFSKTAAQWMLDAGVPKAAAQKIAGQWNEFFGKMVADDQAKRETESKQQLEGLRTEWGDKFEQNAEVARRFLKASGWDDAKVAKYEDAFGTAQMLKDFHAWGSATGEHASTEGDQGGGSFGLGRHAIQKQLDDLRQQRIKNEVTESQFIEQQARLFEQMARAQ